ERVSAVVHLHEIGSGDGAAKLVFQISPHISKLRQRLISGQWKVLEPMPGWVNLNRVEAASRHGVEVLHQRSCDGQVPTNIPNRPRLRGEVLEKQVPHAKQVGRGSGAEG